MRHGDPTEVSFPEMLSSPNALSLNWMWRSHFFALIARKRRGAYFGVPRCWVPMPAIIGQEKYAARRNQTRVSGFNQSLAVLGGGLTWGNQMTTGATPESV